MKKLLYFLFLVSLISCSTVQNYTSNELNPEYYREKNLTFQTGAQIINMEGAYVGNVAQPDFKETFAAAVLEMAEETKLNLKTGSYPDSNIDVKVLEANWDFKLSSAELITKINFHTSFGNYETVGKFKNAGGGSERKNLKNSFKNAIYNFLMEYQKRK
ncbi:hypothetical protein K0U91_14545 [Chryseobacterium chendengshani]|uniref:hypothetical protein n=1 Tax=Chryseobacterium sp. LJ668 TaxID=2864040 RepID=UPI001C690868|nr:hypothetical protein [Chryseobacterium sp. LJ668]MBW8522725.1 hypothetical protein [Chryseobacterium sp. LJ668]QYK16259.1 hypothetical protein K0U91_14545 [Chryseobacterium sp. LJ668]